MPSTGTLVFNDQKLQAPEIYVTESLGVGVSVPTSNLEVVGNAYVSSNLEVVGRVMAGSSKIPVGVDRNDVVVYDQTPHDRPLVKYPEVAMTSATTGGYNVTHSGTPYPGGYEGWRAFDEVSTTEWITDQTARYNTTTPFDANSPSTDGLSGISGVAGTRAGSWVKLELPKKIRLQKTEIFRRDVSDQRFDQAYVYGSNDDTNWYQLSSITNPKYGQPANASGDMGPSIISLSTDSTTFYKYFVIQITSLVDNVGTANIGQAYFYGTEQGDVSTDLTLSSVYNKPGTEQLEVYWDANDTGSYGGSGTTVTDLSGNSVSGTLSGVGFDSTYNAFTFDGSNDVINGTLSNPGGDYVHSVSWWFKPTQTTKAIGTSEQTMWFMGTTWGAGVCSYSSFYGDRFYFAWHTYNINCPTTDISQTQWNHACVTYTGGGSTLTNRSIYINGVKQISSLDNTSGQLLNLPANTYLVLGNQRGQTKYFNGSIANFRLFSKALNADQVKELYDWQKDHFLGFRSSMTLYKGNLGLGVAEPTSRLEIDGALQLSNGASTNVTMSASTANVPDWAVATTWASYATGTGSSHLTSGHANSDAYHYGESLDISEDGTYAVISANQGGTGDGTTQAGEVYVYLRTGTTWAQQAKLIASDKAIGDALGSSVAIKKTGHTSLWVRPVMIRVVRCTYSRVREPRGHNNRS